MQYALVSVGYAGVLVVSAALLYRRHLLELQDPATASGGMFAAGDTMLHVFIGCLFLVPTVNGGVTDCFFGNRYQSRRGQI